MNVHHFADPAAFGASAIPFLVDREAENCLLLGLIATLSSGTSPYTGDNYLAIVEDDNLVVGVALMTPPHGPVISTMADRRAIAAVARDLLPRRAEIPSVLGSVEAARVFVEEWTAATGRSAAIEVHERIFELTEVIPPKLVPGIYRRATDADRETMIALVHDFNVGEHLADPVYDGREARTVDARHGRGTSGYVFWEDGEIVSFAGFGNPTPNGVVVGPVYTPERFRGRGYATAMTATLCADLLARGKKSVYLFTNLVNPISNHVYDKIGFKPVIDADQWRFTDTAGG